MTASLAELIERLEKATGEDVALDREIFWHVEPSVRRPGSEEQIAKLGLAKFLSMTMRRRMVPRYTSSIDAALTLVPEGWQVVRIGENARVKVDGGLRNWHAVLRREGDPIQPFASRDYSPTPALATCSAALKARSQA